MNEIEKKLAALQPASQEELAAKILARIGPSVPRISRLPLLYSGLAGALIGATAMFLLMCTLSQPQSAVQVVVEEVPVETTPQSEPVKPMPMPRREVRPDIVRPEITVLGMRLTPLRSDTLDLDAIFAEQAEIAKRATPKVASVYLRREFGRRATNIEFSPKEYQRLLETIDYRL